MTLSLYNPEFFQPRDMQHARSIILTNEDSSTDQRWQKETDWTIALLNTLCSIDSHSVVLDWGCGIGRLAKPIVERFGCHVVGVDLQPRMLALAQDYVNNPKFSTMTVDQAVLHLPVNYFSHALAVWAFQHSPHVQYEIPLVWRSLQPQAQLFVMENVSKAIPSATSFYDDGVPVEATLQRMFRCQSRGLLPTHIATPQVQRHSWWAVLTREALT
jgi:ubiquinone/menaquinone biosynthesis C-methylase UbiE